MLDIHLIPAFTDNYIFHITFEDGKTAIVDPGTADPVIEYIEAGSKTLDYILITHHHYDHIDGVMPLKEKYGAQVIGHEKDIHRLPRLDKGVFGKDKFSLSGHDIEVIETAGHTLGHICYYFPNDGAVFVGDTVFVMGCGRLFEGSPAQMYASIQKIARLPEDTKIYCAHEYTLANAAYALHAFPKLPTIAKVEKEMQEKRAQGLPTVPTTVKVEKLTNPFFLADDVKEFAELRQGKDNF